MAARGEADRGRVVAAHLAPNGAQIELRQDGDTVTGLVTADLLPPLPMTVSGSAVGAVEPGAS